MDRALGGPGGGQGLGQEDAILAIAGQQDASSRLSRNNSSTKELRRFGRRNSSFAEFFEGDFAQSLLSRRHFWSKDSHDDRKDFKKNENLTDNEYTVDDPGLFMSVSKEKEKHAPSKHKISKVK
jgi:hypothetical protein